jgi:hypothetical protein
VDTINRESDDRIFRETRLLAGVIVPFLLVAFVILYIFPDRTKELFAWGISPPMTALMLGSAYIGGAYFFVRVIAAGRWHQVTIEFPAVAAFASLMGIATVLHWDRFTQGHVSFIAWATLYAVTPFLVVAVWLRNRQVDFRKLDSRDVILPVSLRLGFGAVGSITILVALALFIQPATMIAVWPWQLTPLTARVLGGMFALPGVVGIGVALDPRWSAARITLQSQIISLAFIIVGIVRAWSNFNPGNPVTWLLSVGLVGLLVALIGLHLWIDRRPLRPYRTAPNG